MVWVWLNWYGIVWYDVNWYGFVWYELHLVCLGMA